MLTFADISSSFKSAKTEEELPGIGRIWKYLSDRGIDRDLADRCGIHILTEGELMSAIYNRKLRSPDTSTRAAVVFPHFDYAGDVIPFWSARFVDLMPKNPGLKLVSSFNLSPKGVKILPKMTMPAGELMHAYLAPTFTGRGWSDILPGEKVYIHESVIKAINGSVLGKYSIGLNGVSGWSQKKFEVQLIAEIKNLPWKAKKLQPVIVFDSNIETNWDVQNAEIGLAERIFRFTGQTSIALRLPGPPAEVENSEKGWGFDDYHSYFGDLKAKEFLEGEGIPLDVSELELVMKKLSSEVCFVKDRSQVVDLKTGIFMTRAQFVDMNYATYTAQVDEDGRRVSVPKLWLADSRRRREVFSVDYMPGQRRIFNDKFNAWKEMGCRPEEGDVELWLELLYNNVSDEKMRRWIISWLAYPLQNLGEKMNSLLLIVGKQGTGKGQFLRPFRDIYGDNSITVTSDDLRSSFNSLYANKQFIHADELKKVRDEDDQVNQRLKMLVTDDKMNVNAKGVQQYRHVNCANLVLTSNYTDCIKLDQDDRRACVVRWEGKQHVGDQPYWRKYVEWTEGEGPRALYHFLLNWDLGLFDPAAWAPMTLEKEIVTEAGMGSLEAIVKHLWAFPDDVLPLISEGRALWTAKELATICFEDGKDADQRRKKLITDALRNQGFKQANDGSQLRVGGNQYPYWIIRRRDEDWSESAKCLAHLKPFYKLK